jgi:hypothetical protein
MQFIIYLVSELISEIQFILARPSLWRNRLEARTADQKVWGSIPTRAKTK